MLELQLPLWLAGIRFDDVLFMSLLSGILVLLKEGNEKKVSA